MEPCAEFSTRWFAFGKFTICWIIKNQFGRRNITDYVRGVLSLKMKETLAIDAKEKRSIEQSNRQLGIPSGVNLPPMEKTRKELSKLAGISEKNIDKVEKIELTGIKELLAKETKED